VEFLGGAYYEPIYGVIPRRDLTGQIRLMRTKLEQLFGQAPEGAWLTERVWDPGLVPTLADAGVRYTVLDDTHFEKAGVRSPVTGHYTAGDRKSRLDVFASMKTLRYLIPFRDVPDAVSYLGQLKSGPGRVAVFADSSRANANRSASIPITTITIMTATTWATSASSRPVESK
jgi:hypothetical protein